MKTPKLLSCIALIIAVGGCVVAPLSKGSAGGAAQAAQSRDLRFVVSEFTRPYIEVSPDGSEFFFDVLGEIYRVPMDGGDAIRMELGAGWKTLPVVSDDGEWLIHASDADDGNRDLQFWGKRLGTNDAPRQLGLLWRPREGSPALGSPAYVYQGMRQRWDVATGTLHISDVALEGFKGQCRISRDGRLVGYEVTRGNESLLAIHTPADDTTTITHCVLERTISTLYAPTFAFLPDGKSVLLSRGGKFHRCWFDGRSAELPVSAVIEKSMSPMAKRQGEMQQRTQIRYPAMDQDQRRLTFTAKGKVWQSDSSSAAPERLTAGTGEELMPAFSPDGSRIVYVVQDGRAVTLRIRDVTSGGEQVLLASESLSYANPVWSPDGNRIAFVEVDQKFQTQGPRVSCCSIKYVEMDTNEVHILGSGPYKPLGGSELYPRPTWSAGSDALYYTREVWRPGVAIIDRLELVRQALGNEPVVLLATQPAIHDIVVSPDETRVALRDRLGVSVIGLPEVVDGKSMPIRLITLDESRRMRRLWLDGPDYLAWAPDNRLLWSIQDEVFTGLDADSVERIARVELPVNTRDVGGIKVYLGARIVTMSAAGTIENGVMVTGGNRIRYIGEAASLPAEFAGFQPIDLQGKTVIPGLVDVHRHTLVRQDDFAALRSYPLFANLAYGVTTIYDPSVHTVKSAYLTDLSRDDGYPGSSFHGSGLPLLDDSNNGGYSYIGGLADARSYVDRAAKAGVPLVKAYLRRERADRRLIARAAGEAGIGVASHENNVIHTQLSQVQDGYTAIEHTLLLGSAPFYADVIEYLKGSGVALTPSIADVHANQLGAFMWQRLPRDERFACLIDTPDQRRRWKQVDARGVPFTRGSDGEPGIQASTMDHVREYAAMLDAGIPVSIGAHALPAGIGTHWEMWALVQGGAAPINVLKAATVNGARKLGLQHRIGSLEEGMDADFVVLNSNPVTDIHNTADIAYVVRRGRVVQWPDGDDWPQSWPDEGDWNACRAWNLGVSGDEADLPPTLH